MRGASSVTTRKHTESIRNTSRTGLSCPTRSVTTFVSSGSNPSGTTSWSCGSSRRTAFWKSSAATLPAMRPLLDGQSRARYLGPIYQRERVFALRKNAFAYVHGHTVGGTNPSLLEAMASANFVVAKDVEFNREVIGELGRYFATEEQLTRIVGELEQADPDSIDRLGRAARAVIEEKFQWHHVIEAYAKVIGAAISGKGEGGA
ncbi:MAG: hypothetical protein DMD67_04010 [Gemmatimonadetes bacterium]|nr:MAG: hypothetical protein DMD67_04010 [Gemmatimonadota bacterium]